MNRKITSKVLPIFVVLALIFASSGCGKFISRLQANHHFTKANGHFSDGRYRDAIEEYEIALASNPDLVEAYRFLGESYKSLYRIGLDTPENIERAEKALTTLIRANEIDPYDRDIIYSLGDMYDKLRNFKEAEKMYLRIIELEPTNMENYYVVAGFYKRYVAGKGSGESDEKESEGEEVGQTPFQKAEEMYLRRIELDPESPEGYAHAAQFYEEIQPPDFDKAYVFHKHRIKYEPDNHLPLYAIGVNRFWKAYRLQNILSKEERIKAGREAEEALLKAIELDPSYSYSYSYLEIINRNVFSMVYPERKSRYIDEANLWHERFDAARKKELEKKKLEQELEETR